MELIETTKKSKSGGKIYIADLDEIVEEKYGARKDIGSAKEYICMCPICKERHNDRYDNYKLYIDKDLTIGYCFVCQNTFLAIPEESANREVSSEIEDLLTTEFGYKDNDIHLPDLDFSLLNNMPPLSKSDEGLKYLLNRNKYLNPEDYSLKYLKNKVVIPFKMNGSNIFYQIRYCVPFNPKMKYFTPPIGHKPFYIASNHGDWRPDKPVVLTEGVFSALGLNVLGLDLNIIALLGKTLTNYQYKLLKYLGLNNRVYCYLDETQLSIKLQNDIDTAYNLKSCIIESDGRDQEEMLNDLGYDEYKSYVIDQISKSVSDNSKPVFNEYIGRDLNLSVDKLFYAKLF